VKKNFFGLMLLDIFVFVIIAKSLHFLSDKNYIIITILPLYLLLLYIFNFYKKDRGTFVNNIAATILMLLVFDIFNVLLQYIVFYDNIYGRKVVLKLDILLLIYHSFRWFLLKNFISKQKQGIIFLKSEDMLQNSLLKNIKQELLKLKDFDILGEVLLKNNTLMNENDESINLENHILLIDNIDKLSESEREWLLSEKIKGRYIYTIENFYETFLEKIPIFSVTDEWFILSQGFENIFEGSYVRTRRIFDVIVSILGMLIASPIILITAIMIKLDSEGSILFTQTRTGQYGESFTIYKFRSMKIDAEANGAKWAEKNDPRITKVGNFIRKTRIDEIPQLWNVLIGDMSFIGPRPERPEFDGQLEKKIPYYRLRYLVKPGLTGWAQVNYNYAASIEDTKEKIMYDLYYIKNYSFLLDMRIILRTIRIVLFQKGR
jgi:exopolysaccharide biosynthesis polyprenyl glycosylphosphotransferase